MRFLLPSHHLADPNAGAAGADLCLATALRRRGHAAEPLFLNDVLSHGLHRTRWAAVVFPWALAERLTRRGGTDSFDVIESTAGDLWVTDLLLSHSGRRDRPLLAVRTHGLEHLHAAAGRALARRAGMKLSLRYRAYHHGYRLFEVLRDLRRSALVIVHNAADRQYAVDRLCIDPAKVHVVHLGIGADFLTQANEDESRRAGVLFVGGWHSGKGVDLLPGILDRVAARLPAVPFTLAGLREPPERVLPAFGSAVAQRLTVLPVVPHAELPALMSRHSVFVFPSRIEGFGLVLIEAMACGMLVVTSPVGVVPEVVKTGWNAFIVNEQAAAAYADAVITALRQGDQTRAVRENARATARGFTWERAATARETLYGELLAGGGVR